VWMIAKNVVVVRVKLRRFYKRHWEVISNDVKNSPTSNVTMLQREAFNNAFFFAFHFCLFSQLLTFFLNENPFLFFGAVA
jgi:hypothetical protein